MTETISYKSFFKNYGLFLAIIAGCFLILIYSILVTNKSWQNNLKVCVERVLDESDPNIYSIENFKRINKPLSMTAACYDIRNKKTGELNVAVIVRVASFYGPLAGVYVMDKDQNVVFKGFSSLHGRLANNINSINANKRIEYWKNLIPEIIK